MSTFDSEEVAYRRHKRIEEAKDKRPPLLTGEILAILPGDNYLDVQRVERRLAESERAKRVGPK